MVVESTYLELCQCPIFFCDTGKTKWHMLDDVFFLDSTEHCSTPELAKILINHLKLPVSELPPDVMATFVLIGARYVQPPPHPSLRAL